MGNFLRGDYNFAALTWGHTTQVSLDPTLCTHSNFGETVGSIDGFQVVSVIFVAIIGLVIIIIKSRKKSSNFSNH